MAVESPLCVVVAIHLCRSLSFPGLYVDTTHVQRAWIVVLKLELLMLVTISHIEAEVGSEIL
jgi:hypothetical protein